MSAEPASHTAAEIVQASDSSPVLHEAVVDVAARGGKISTKALGRWFARHKGRIVDGLRLCGGEPGKDGIRWWIERAP